MDKEQFFENYHTIDQICELFGVSKRTIKRKLKEKKIKGAKIFGIWRIPKEEIDRIMKEGI